MHVLFAVVIGALYAAGFYLILRRTPVRVILGLIFLGHAAHLLLFVSARLTRGRPPLIPEGAEALTLPYADPLPQALVLTALVIGFAIIAFAVVLFYRAHDAVGHDDLDRLGSPEG